MTDEVRDSNGNELKDGDNVTLIKDLKVKGANVTLKRGKSTLVALPYSKRRANLSIEQSYWRIWVTKSNSTTIIVLY